MKFGTAYVTKSIAAMGTVRSSSRSTFARGVIGTVGAWIAFQQMHLARVKLQHDTYDRKYAVFQGVSWVLLIVAGLKRAPSVEDIGAFIKVIGAASFLFDDKLVAYLKEIERRVYRANGLNDVINHLSDDDKPNASKELEEHIGWLSEQNEVVIEKFRPSLELRKKRPCVGSWLLQIGVKIVGQFTPARTTRNVLSGKS